MERAAAEAEAARHADELLAEVEAEKRGKDKKGKKKKKGGGSGGAGPSQDPEVPSEAAAAKPAKLDREGLIRLLETLHEERIRYGITAETSVEGLAARWAKAGSGWLGGPVPPSRRPALYTDRRDGLKCSRTW